MPLVLVQLKVALVVQALGPVAVAGQPRARKMPAFAGLAMLAYMDTWKRTWGSTFCTPRLTAGLKRFVERIGNVVPEMSWGTGLFAPKFRSKLNCP